MNSWELSNSDKLLVPKKNSSIYFRVFTDFDFPYTDFFFFNFLWAMLVYVIDYTKRMLYSEQPTVLLEKPKHDVFNQFWKFHFLQFLLFFIWGLLPSTNLVDRAVCSYMSLRFSFLLIFYISLFWNLQICSYMLLLFFPVFFTALYLVHLSIYFYSSFCSLFCFLSISLSLFVHLSFHFCYTFFSLDLLLCSVCFSLLFYY